MLGQARVDPQETFIRPPQSGLSYAKIHGIQRTDRSAHLGTPYVGCIGVALQALGLQPTASQESSGPSSRSHFVWAAKLATNGADLQPHLSTPNCARVKELQATFGPTFLEDHP